MDPRRLLWPFLALSLCGCAAGPIDDAADEEELPPDDVPPDVTGGGGGAGATGGGRADAAAGAKVDGGGGRTDAGADASKGAGGAAKVYAKLGLGSSAAFLWGLGNDGNAADSISGLKLHYVYLSNFDWLTWTPNQPEGQYARLFADGCAQHGHVPVMTLYQGAAWGDGNISGFEQDSFMQPYWHGYDVLLSQMGAYGKPVIIDVEPDFWGYAVDKTWYTYGQNPGNFPVPVTKFEPGCSGLPNTLVGFGQCLVKLAHQKPNVLIGFAPSAWGGSGKPQQIADIMKKVGAGDADVVFFETLDRDAGCWEAQAPECQGRGNGAGMYWDDAGFASHFTFVKTMTTTLGRPAIWWQTPMGVPSTTAGGTPGHYRDNRVATFFGDPGALAAIGGLGVMYGVGAGNQTTWNTDGGQLKNALAKYVANPVALP